MTPYLSSADTNQHIGKVLVTFPSIMAIASHGATTRARLGDDQRLKDLSPCSHARVSLPKALPSPGNLTPGSIPKHLTY